MTTKKQYKKNIKLIDNTNYYLHFFESETLKNFTYINIKDFIDRKKNKKRIKSNIFLGDCLEYLGYTEATNLLEDLVSTIDSGYKIIVQGIDIKSISQSFANDEITDVLFNNLIYGQGKICSISFFKMKYIIENINNLKISSIKFMNSIYYYIECTTE
jgi:alkyl hydroperoxide reductase subunit AhpF